jgi:hypothetical protein
VFCKTRNVGFFTSLGVEVGLFHEGRWMGAENSKHMGTRSGGRDSGLSLFWDCCDEETPNGPGCRLARHKSYDDE